MSTINLQPQSQLSSKVLTVTGSYSEVLSLLPGSPYTSSAFITGAVNAVSRVYNFFVGNILDIELETRNVYECYLRALLKYSYLINTHHAKNILYDVLGFSTSTFNAQGQILTGSDFSLKNPNFSIASSRNIAQAFGNEIGVGGNMDTYSASFDIVSNQQDYDLDSILSSSSNYSGTVAGKRILIRQVFFQTRPSYWRFFMSFGAYGSMGGGFYSNFSNNSTFFLQPAWQDKLQMMSMEDKLNVRSSHYTYEIMNNKLRIYPIPSTFYPEKMWFRFSVEGGDALSGSNPASQARIDGINNLNTLPLGNIPVENINAPGHEWIYEYTIALAAKALGLLRGKIGAIPFPKGSVTLNSADLLSMGKEDLDKLEERLMKLLDEMARNELSKRKAEEVNNALDIMSHVPPLIFIR